MPFCSSFINYISPFAIIFVSLYGYYCFIVQFCLLYLYDTYIKQLAYIIVFNFFFWMFIWAFVRTVIITHAEIPEEYKISLSEHRQYQAMSQEQVDKILKRLVVTRQLNLNTRTQQGKVRYCNKCYTIKPDRAHHCSICGKCILKMDHHCPWVGNCIGHANYKSFILMLIYGCIMNVFYLGTLSEYFVELWEEFTQNFAKMLLCIGYVIAVMGALLTGTLCLYHFGLILHNETTLEAMQETYFTNDNFTFDLGKRNNISEAFGSSFCCWLIPISVNGNGYEFPVHLSYEYD